MQPVTFLTPLRAAVLPILLTLGTPAATAPKDSVVFDLSIRGIRAGQLAMNGAESNGRYSAAGRLASTGLLAMIRKVSYEATANGAVKAGRYSPTRYTEKADTGKRVSSEVMTYRRGVPVPDPNKPRDVKPYSIDPNTQAGTVDPMTALYAALRDVPRDQVCALNLQMFDGSRRSQIKFSNPKADGDGFTCTGEYRRLKGFSPDDMAEKSRFPFSVVYAPMAGGEYRVMRITMDTLYGTGVLKRR